MNLAFSLPEPNPSLDNGVSSVNVERERCGGAMNGMPQRTQEGTAWSLCISSHVKVLAAPVISP
ncbi:MAG: hypothetical protein ACOVN0_04630 [Niveispirillum sp.]|uniref:hypothetical protein n=1 Tax=Niveispirillum sp. TaxID=1917217 RepID=UPI003BA7A8B1